MDNFVFCNPTRILFGKGQISELSAQVPKNLRAMLVYGGGSIKANGVYDQVIRALAGRELIEFSGIEANPLLWNEDDENRFNPGNKPRIA